MHGCVHYVNVIMMIKWLNPTNPNNGDYGNGASVGKEWKRLENKYPHDNLQNIHYV